MRNTVFLRVGIYTYLGPYNEGVQHGWGMDSLSVGLTVTSRNYNPIIVPLSSHSISHDTAIISHENSILLILPQSLMLVKYVLYIPRFLPIVQYLMMIYTHW